MNEIQAALLELWREVLKRPDIGCDDDFFLSRRRLALRPSTCLYRIEKELQYELPITILVEAPTVRQLDFRLDRATLGAINDIIRIHTTGTQRPLFVIGGACGHVLRQSSALRALGPDQPCYGLQPPGMDWAGAGCATIPEMAAHYIGVMQAIQPHGPYRLFGDSFGGLVVFEMALQLQRMGESIAFLGMIDTYDTSRLRRRRHRHCTIAGARAFAAPPNSIEAVGQRVIKTHLRA